MIGMLASVMKIFEENGFRYYVDTNQHRKRPFATHRYRDNDVMDLQLNIFGFPGPPADQRE